MAQSMWQGSGSTYTLAWGNQPWTLELEADRPGLRLGGRPGDCLLALEGVAAAGRFDPDALNGKALVRVEQMAGRVEATYVAPRWGGLELRARWSPTSRHDGVDLEVQVSASSVGELRGLEIFVRSRIAAPGNAIVEPDSISVQPRDCRSAGFSYDGRMPAADLRRLTTLPLQDSSEAGMSQVAALGPGLETAGHYMEMVHPHDVARKIFWGERQAASACAGVLHVSYGLFGHDLEKGVVIRARIRGLWIPASDIAALPPAALRDFLATPPPLGP